MALATHYQEVTLVLAHTALDHIGDCALGHEMSCRDTVFLEMDNGLGALEGHIRGKVFSIGIARLRSASSCPRR